jgi:hypothetical protein
MDVAVFCVIWYGRITNYCSSIYETTLNGVRTWLGPLPQSYYILADGRVVPSTTTLPIPFLGTHYQYTPGESIIRQSFSTVRPKRFAWIAVEIDHNDLSDWIQTLRWVGEQEPSLCSLVTLWSMIHQRVFEFGTTIHATKNTTEECHISYS